MSTIKITHWITGAEIAAVEAESMKDAVVKCVRDGKPLTGAYLRGAYLTGADLSGAYLRGADLSGADLTGADLTGAHLRGADLTGAYLTGALVNGHVVVAATNGSALGYSWLALVFADVETTFQYGCECGPLSWWTPENISELAVKHVNGDARYVRLHAALIAFVREWEAVVRPVENLGKKEPA